MGRKEWRLMCGSGLGLGWLGLGLGLASQVGIECDAVLE